MLIVDKMWKSYQSQVRRDLRTPISTLKISIKDLLLTNDVDAMSITELWKQCIPSPYHRYGLTSFLYFFINIK